jgi:Ni/Co efflux regulator RcnB
MKSILSAALIAAAVATPMLASAHDDGARAVRAGVLAQIRQLADAGYRGNGDETTYPRDVEAAQQRIDPRSAQPGAPADTSGYGAQTGTHSESGARRPASPQSLYFGA